MKLLDLLTSLSKRGMAGATIEELRNEFGERALNEWCHLISYYIDMAQSR